MEYVTLNTGTKMPAIALGLWKVKKEDECIAAVKAGLEVGYRHFDSAQYYGNEQFLGQAIKESSVPRGEVFLTTKIKNENFWPEDVLESFDVSLEKLQTDYIDLLLLHFPVTELRVMAWGAMEEIFASGRTKAIGVSNYTIRHLEELLKTAKVKPAVNQVELHVFLQQPELLEYCKQHDITVEAYSPLAHGESMDDPTLAEIAKKHGKTPPQVMLRWCLDVGTVPLPKSTHADRIKQNYEIFDFKLDDDDMTKLKALDKNLRTCWDPTNVP